MPEFYICICRQGRRALLASLSLQILRVMMTQCQLSVRTASPNSLYSRLGLSIKCVMAAILTTAGNETMFILVKPYWMLIIIYYCN